MAFEIKGKTALVTGANRGIGKATVESLLAAGAAKIYAAVRRPDSARELVEAHHGQVEILELDLGRPETIRAAAAQASDVDLVVNNAGILRVADPLSAEVFGHLQEEIDVNVFGLLHVAQAFAPVLEARGGALVQLNSVASMKSFADFASYCASKAAAYSFTQALRDKLSARGIHVLSVHPGPIATEMADSAGLGDMAEPATVVSEGIVRALESGEFHLFPDTMARQMGEAYAGFAADVVEGAAAEG